ncbi:simple sugar transport system permease protein [Natronincola peptidivorans]|uniref:Simple sugar transport system permease protein n=1 Tax=Natronincola peptidivorans TaxID=426128 RepID=A0A1I0GW24_9FIRM|nr:ABC transporter permease [Natronincola peptidivorans]SET74716.1 simple sugar transport system permease protein [Natronincola peptidivorans]
MLDSLGFIIGTTLMYSTPLIYAALGGVMSENSGVVNIGLEGMMTIGALIGATVGFYSGNPWLAFLAAGMAGGGLALLHAVASVSYGADQVVSGIAINFLGPGLALFLSRIFFEGATMTKAIPLDNKMPRPIHGLLPRNSFLDLVFNQYATVYIAFLLVGVVWFLLYRTKLGLRIRAVGEHPRAADTLGVSVYKIRYLCVVLSGVLAGFGGASMSLAIVSNFRPTLISGHGFIALAAMIFGKWKPQGAMWACLLFGVSNGLVVYLGRSDAPFEISMQLLSMLPYVLTLIVLMGFVGRSSAPAANGVPYEEGER